MKILIVTNRLHEFGGAEAYTNAIGQELKKLGHQIQFFGIYYDEPIFSNDYSVYAKKSRTPFQLVENKYNRKAFATLLDLFKPDIVHFNLIYFYLTPSIVCETKKRNIKTVMTVHDSKIVCPSYQTFNYKINKPCTLCINKHFFNCVKYKCHKNSLLYSYLAYVESRHNYIKGYYNLIDKFIFPSIFMFKLHMDFGIPQDKSLVICNFSRIDSHNHPIKRKEKYILFFGRLTKVKGTDVLKRIVLSMKNCNFIIAGEGDQESIFSNIDNCKLVGFKNGDELIELISNAVCTVYPSVWLENCPLSVIESISLGTPVVASKIGGIPDLIDQGVTGFLANPSKPEEFVRYITQIYEDDILANRLSSNCIRKKEMFSKESYIKSLVSVYHELLK